MGFNGFYRVSMGLTRFYWVLPSFTGFYWVLLGFRVDGGMFCLVLRPETSSRQAPAVAECHAPQGFCRVFLTSFLPIFLPSFSVITGFYLVFFSNCRSSDMRTLLPYLATT